MQRNRRLTLGPPLGQDAPYCNLLDELHEVVWDGVGVHDMRALACTCRTLCVSIVARRVLERRFERMILAPLQEKVDGRQVESKSYGGGLIELYRLASFLHTFRRALARRGADAWRGYVAIVARNGLQMACLNWAVANGYGRGEQLIGGDSWLVWLGSDCLHATEIGVPRNRHSMALKATQQELALIQPLISPCDQVQRHVFANRLEGAMRPLVIHWLWRDPLLVIRWCAPAYPGSASIISTWCSPLYRIRPMVSARPLPGDDKRYRTVRALLTRVLEDDELSSTGITPDAPLPTFEAMVM
jgi:hypothetical protein